MTVISLVLDVVVSLHITLTLSSQSSHNTVLHTCDVIAACEQLLVFVSLLQPSNC